MSRSTIRQRTIALIGVLGGVFFSTSAIAASTGPVADRIRGPFEASVYASGLKSPDGMAFHPLTGELYVADEVAGEVYVIRNGRAVPALKPGWSLVDDVPMWAIKPNKTKAYWLNNRVRSPEGIAFSPEGHLFVTEDIANGRILEFLPNAQGEFDSGRVIPVPWLDKQYEWEAVTVAKDGRLFIAGSSTSFGPGLFFGSILMRDADQIWWAVDYAPFASFSSLALSRDEDILVVGEEFPGAVTWWDTDRQKDIGGIEKRVPNVEGVTVMPDGGIILVQESQGDSTGDIIGQATGMSGGGRLLLADPESHELTVIAEGFGTIESVVIAPDTGFLYVSEDSSGKIIELRPTKNLLANEYLLKRSLQEFEILNGYSPKRWPGFLSSFMDRIGVETTDEENEEVVEEEIEQMAELEGEEDLVEGFTLQEFADRVPIVAGKIKAELQPGSNEDDPITEIQFISFFPNHALNTGARAMPSVSLFAATRESGKVERTKLVNDFKVAKRLSTGEYIEAAEEASLYVPLTTCSAVQFGNTLNLVLSYIGLGANPDFHIQLACGATPEGTLLVDRDDEGSARYKLNVIDYTTEGHKKMNFVIAGINPRKEEGIRWLEIGERPSMGLVNMAESVEGEWVSRWVTRRNNALHELMVKSQEDERMAFDRYIDSLQPTEMAHPARLPGYMDEQPRERAESEMSPRFSEDGSDPKGPHFSEESNPDAPRFSEDTTPAAPRFSEDTDPSAPRFSNGEEGPDAPVLSQQPGDDPDAILSKTDEEDDSRRWANLLLTRAVIAFEMGAL